MNDQEVNNKIKESVSEMIDVLKKNEGKVECLVSMFRIGGNNYSVLLGDVVEVTKMILDTRNESENFDSIMRIQQEVTHEIDKAMSAMRTYENRNNPSVN